MRRKLVVGLSAGVVGVVLLVVCANILFMSVPPYPEMARWAPRSAFYDALQADRERHNGSTRGRLLVVVYEMPLTALKELEPEIADLTVTHDDCSVRLSASEKLARYRLNSPDASIFDEKVKAEIDKERRTRIASIADLLRQGELEGARKRFREVAFTLDDSYDHATRLSAIECIRLYAEQEKKQGVNSLSSMSVFRSLVAYGLLSCSYPCSIASHLDDMDEPGFEEQKEEILALQSAMQVFDASGATLVAKRLEIAMLKGDHVPYEQCQVLAILRLLGPNCTTAAASLIEVAAGAELTGSDPFWVEMAIDEVMRYDADKVRVALEKSSLSRSGPLFQRLRERAG